MNEANVKIIFKQKEITTEEELEELRNYIENTIQEAIQEQLIENKFQQVSIGKLKITVIDKLKDKETNELSISMLETICAYVDSFVEFIKNGQNKE